MTTALRIFALASEDPDATSFLASLARSDTQIDIIERVTDLDQVQPGTKPPADAILVPLRLKVAHGAAACLILRSHPVFSSIPIVGLIPTKDAAIVSSFYSAGADSVATAPFESENIRGQIHALVRRREFFKEYFQPSPEEEKGSLAVLSLQAMSNGCLIVEQGRNVLFANHAAYELLGATDDLGTKIFDPIILHAALSTKPGAPRHCEVTRPDGQRVTVLVNSRNLEGEATVQILELHDAALWDHLNYRLVQALRTRTLSLLSAAGSLSWLTTKFNQVPLSPVAKLQGLLQEERLYCSLSQVTRALLEIIDVVAAPRNAIKVSLPSDPLIATRFSDAFMLLGHLVLQALDMAGPSGQTSLSTADFPEEGIVEITVASEFPALVTRDEIESALIRKCKSGDFSAEAALPSAARLPFGLEAAQEIADKYQTEIQLKESPSSLKLRVALPLQQNEVITTSEWTPPKPPQK